jgi:hypothetical protein
MVLASSSDFYVFSVTRGLRTLVDNSYDSYFSPMILYLENLFDIRQDDTGIVFCDGIT